MSTNLSLHPGNAQWIGQRAEQQDAFGFLGCEARGGRQTGDVLVVLADGMGGLQRGGEASRLAVRTFLDHFAPAGPSATPSITEILSHALDAAHRAVNTLARDTDGAGEVGATLIAAAVRAGRLHWIGVGDSRLYLYRAADGSLTACNDPHNLEQQLWPRVIAGELTPDDIAAHPDREALTSFLGLTEIPEIDASLRPLPLEPGDRLLLCSDGVDGVLARDELRAVLPGDPQHAAETLISSIGCTPPGLDVTPCRRPPPQQSYDWVVEPTTPMNARAVSASRWICARSASNDSNRCSSRRRSTSSTSRCRP